MTVKENWDDEEVNEKMNVFPALEYNGFDSLNWKSLIILGILILIKLAYKKIHPILLIGISAGLGILFYGLIP